MTLKENMTAIKLPGIIQNYIEASNEHDVKSILACFSDDAVVQDEQEELRGQKNIKGWLAKTIEKYKFHFKPISARENDGKVVVAVEVSGTFDGSPVTLDYHVTIKDGLISALTIE